MILRISPVGYPLLGKGKGVTKDGIMTEREGKSDRYKTATVGADMQTLKGSHISTQSQCLIQTYNVTVHSVAQSLLVAQYSVVSVLHTVL